jgi:membrane associated rhomboid family serine protease
VVTAGQFALTAAALRGEWWRLWTGHFVHYDIAHLTTNAIAALGPLALVEWPSRRRLLLTIPIIAPALSLLLLAFARFDEYRGASGLALALWVGAALTLARAGGPAVWDTREASVVRATARDRQTGYALLFIVAAKLAAEAAGAGHVWHGVAALPLAHVAGSLAGVFAATLSTSPRGTSRATRTRNRSAMGRPKRAPHARGERYCAGT